MCTPKMKVQTPTVTQAPENPAPPEATASANQSGAASPEKNEGNPLFTNRKGRSSLRITRTNSAGTTGLNIPQ